MKENNNTAVWGFIILIVGIVFLGNSLNCWYVNIFFRGWWTLFIIIPSLVGLFKKQTFLSSFLVLTLGILLLYASQDLISWSMVGKVFIPEAIIVLGLSLIFKPNFSHIKVNKKNNLPEYIGIFSGTEEKITDDFNGSSCVAVFGGVDLDLTDCKIKDDVVIECVCVFGGIDLKVPKNINVKTNGVPVFGGIENKAPQENNSKKPTIFINYVCIFGGVEIK